MHLLRRVGCIFHGSEQRSVSVRVFKRTHGEVQALVVRVGPPRIAILLALDNQHLQFSKNRLHGESLRSLP